MPPSLLTLAVRDFGDLPAVPGGADVMYMTASSARLQELLVRSLGDVRAASRVVRLVDLADAQEADVVLTPVIKQPVAFSCEGLSGSWWASGGLWLLTWIGGMAVDDSTYQSKMEVDCTFTFPRSKNKVGKVAASTAVDVSFLERNAFFSWPTLQSLVLPPFWTSDEADSTREVLTQRAVNDVAQELARYMKRGFEDDAYDKDNCKVAVESPVNGSQIDSDTVTVRGSVAAVEQVKSIRIVVNGGAPVVVEPTKTRDATPHYGFQCEASGLRPGPNYIRILVVAGDECTRTLQVTRTIRT